LFGSTCTAVDVYTQSDALPLSGKVAEL